LAKEPGDRYQSGTELIEAIDAIDPNELKAIELLTSRSVNTSISGNTHTPTALSQAQAAVKTSRNNPDLTTVSAAALHTRNNTKVPNKSGANPAVASKTGANQRVAAGQQQKVPGKTPATDGQAATRPSGKTPTAPQKAVSSKDVSSKEVSSKTPTSGINKAVPSSERISALSGTQAAVNQSSGSAAKNWSDGESLFVDEEDRRERGVEVTAKRRWPWAVAAMLVLAAGGSVYFRALLPEPLAGGLDQVAQSGLQLKNTLIGGIGTEKMPAQINTPAVAVVPNPPQQAIPQTESAPTVVVEDQGAMGQAGSLREKMKTDLSVAPQLAQLYRDTLRANPGMKNAERGLQDVREYHERNIRDALTQKDIETAQRFIASLEASFSGELTDDQKHQALRKELENAQRAQVYIDKATEYFAADALSAPKGANAIEAYRQALTIDPGNPLALAGLKQVVNRYIELANTSAADGKWEDVLQSARRGLEIDKANVELLKLQEQSGQQLAHRGKVIDMLSAAQEQMSNGNLIEPKGDSAYDRYQQLLTYDKGNSDAHAGLREVEQQLAFRVEGLINRSQFEQAEQLIDRSSEKFPGSDRLEALNRSLDLAVEADIIARQPKIPQLLISGKQPASINEPQSPTLKVERTLYIGFSYANFVAENSVVQAVLYDGSRTMEINQVPVVVSGKDGVKFFQIERPVEGFGEGGYNIDLILDGNKLRSTAFRVTKQ
jgi:tetratricopeptide (TPR) repeat protein